jgi:thioredoxin reductase (NADPH)
VSDIRKLVIVGSGPAGYTAGLYAARADLRPVVVEGAAYGGALMTTTDVENYPGFPDGVLGPELMDSMRKQTEKFGAELISDDATAVNLTGPVKTVTVGGSEYRAETVILAMGSKYRYLGLDNEQRLLGHGVSACATCDGFFFRDTPIAVVGGGDSAMEEATFLTKFASSVTIIHRRDALRASTIMADRAKANDKIAFRWNTVVDDVLGDEKVAGLALRDTKTGETSTLDVGGLFVAIGHDPQSELVRGQVELDDAGYVQVDAPSSRTNLDGVFACGDLVDFRYRQAVTAAGTGCVAALDAEHYLAAQGEASQRAASQH